MNEQSVTFAGRGSGSYSGFDQCAIQAPRSGDYQCPYCGDAHEVVKQIQERLGDQLCFAFRNFPLVKFIHMRNTPPRRRNLPKGRGASGNARYPVRKSKRVDRRGSRRIRNETRPRHQTSACRRPQPRPLAPSKKTSPAARNSALTGLPHFL